MVIISLSASSRTVALLGTACQRLPMPEWFEAAAKIIDIAKEFEYTHG